MVGKLIYISYKDFRLLLGKKRLRVVAICLCARNIAMAAREGRSIYTILLYGLSVIRL